VGEVERHVAFIRAINVAGHASVKMSDLREAFAAAGCRSVKTYIQSGNVVFESPRRSTTAVVRRVRAELRERLGCEPEVMVRTARDLEEIVSAAPFTSVEAEAGVKLYVAFLSRKPRNRPRFPIRSPKEALTALTMTNREVFIVSRRKPNGFYGFPNNFIEEALGVSATSRNWTTVRRIVECARRTSNG
jgi:uncharacterized protein (DUF1697 family)